MQIFALLGFVAAAGAAVTAQDRTFSSADCTGAATREFDITADYSECKQADAFGGYYFKYDCTFPNNTVTVSLWPSAGCNGAPDISENHPVGRCLHLDGSNGDQSEVVTCNDPALPISPSVVQMAQQMNATISSH